MTDGTARATDPNEAFDLVGDETRFAIVRALWDLTDWRSDPASFAELRAEAGVKDSGQFNYHLDRLCPEFVRSVDGGYRLTEAGRRVVGGAVSGIYTDHDVSFEPEPVGACPACEGTLELGYEGGFMTVTCGDCDKRLVDMSTPPVLIAESDPENIPSVLTRHAMAEVQRMNRGFCVYCGGPLESRLDLPSDGAGFDDLVVEFDCAACEKSFQWNVFVSILDHPAVVSLLHDAGIDVRDLPVWSVFTDLDLEGRIASSDPLRVEATIQVEHGAVTVTLDETLTTVDYAESTANEPPE